MLLRVVLPILTQLIYVVFAINLQWPPCEENSCDHLRINVPTSVISNAKEIAIIIANGNVQRKISNAIQTGNVRVYICVRLIFVYHQVSNLLNRHFVLMKKIVTCSPYAWILGAKRTVFQNSEAKYFQ